jgi:hypothetical protein
MRARRRSLSRAASHGVGRAWSHRLIARNVGLSKNTVMAIVKRGAAAQLLAHA